MKEIMIGLQFSALIPIVILLVYKPRLNLFFKLLLISIFLSIISDSIGTYAAFIYHNNLFVGCIYSILNTLLITILWQKVPFYSIKLKSLIGKTGYSLVAIMILVNIYLKFSIEAIYMLCSLNIFFWLSLSLIYYYQKIQISSYTPLLLDPYFITATAFLLFGLSTIIILAAQIHFGNHPDIRYTWVLRQCFYFIYNIIIGYSFYVLFKIQQKQ